MPDPPVTDLALEDYTSVIGIAADTLGGPIHFNAVIRNFEFRNVKIPGHDSNDRLYWQALFDAAMQHKVDSPKELIKYIVDNGVSQEEMDKALSQVAREMYAAHSQEKVSGSLRDNRVPPSGRYCTRHANSGARFA